MPFDATDNVIRLPTLHPGQVAAYDLFNTTSLVALRCGRRWGKTDMAVVVGASSAMHSQPVGYFAPDYKILTETYNRLMDTLGPAITHSNKNDGVIRTATGGVIEFWTLENERAGRSRKYKKVIIDEAAFTKSNMTQIWETSIKPTLLDLGGMALVMSTPNGLNRENFFWRCCNDPTLGFTPYHAPSIQNPHLPNRYPHESDLDFAVRRALAFEKIKQDNPPLVYQQEWLAEFVDWRGALFFDIRNLLDDQGQAYDLPGQVDAVFATIDSATKTGSEHDGTAVVYWARCRNAALGPPLMVLDWDIVQIEGDLLENWLPTVDQQLQLFARQLRARNGSAGIHIEDKASGMILIRQAQRKNMQVMAIDSKLTSVGKEERAISVSGYVYRKEVKISKQAYARTKDYKRLHQNHFLTQVFGFKIGEKSIDDDLLDAFTYGVSLALGDAEGN